ncbi:MAG: hypothetical protein LBQ82_05675 [Treponema sp.]|nr:hypothetical protein [Treponema sp.]
MKTVFLLKHSHWITLDENLTSDETKLLGIYETKEKAEAAIEFYKTLPGFKDLPEGRFSFDECELNKNYWEEGFIAVNKMGDVFTDYDENFADADDFIDCIRRGCELEFSYNRKHYYVNPFGYRVSVMNVDDENSEIQYDTPREALNYPIGDKCLGDILQEMKIINRTL